MNSAVALPSAEVGQRVKRRTAGSGTGRRYLVEPSPWRPAHLKISAGLMAPGGVALFLGWYGIGREVTFREQSGWLVLSSTATVLVMLGLSVTVIAGFRGVRSGQRQIAADLAAHFGISSSQTGPIATPLSSPATSPAAVSARVTLVGLRRVHLPSCPMVEGKAVEPQGPAWADDPTLHGCGVCGP